MDIETITKDLKSTTDFIVKGAEGKVRNLTDSEAAEFEKVAMKQFREASNDLVYAKLSPVSNMDVLKINIHFFDNLPNVFGAIQNLTEYFIKTGDN